MDNIKVLRVVPGEHPEEVDIENSLESLQKEVGGLIEFLEIDDSIDVILNEEGKLLKLPPNRRFGSDVLCGTFLIARCSEDGETISLLDNDITNFSKKFYEPDTFPTDFNHDDYISIRMWFGDDNQ